MNRTDYEALRRYFDDADESMLRGNTSESGLFIYASHLLDRLQVKEGSKLLDLGCGDGLLMAMIQKMRPDLHIDGIEFSENLARQARINNPRSNISVGNILEIPMPATSYHCIFSFSFLQYISPHDVQFLHRRLFKLLNPGGKILHCSVPDIRMRPVNIAEIQFRKFAYHAWWRTPLIILRSFLQNKHTRYGANTYWYDPLELNRELSLLGKSAILPGDVYYRFDLDLIPHQDCLTDE